MIGGGPPPPPPPPGNTGCEPDGGTPAGPTEDGPTEGMPDWGPRIPQFCCYGNDAIHMIVAQVGHYLLQITMYVDNIL